MHQTNIVLIKSVRGYNPTFGKDCYFAENSTIIGDVIIGDQVSVWFQAVIRGDVNSIRIGNKVNIQDGAIIHGTYKKASTNIGDNISIGLNAFIHGCKLHDNVLIGMGSIVWDNCVIYCNSIIAAGSVLIKNTIVPSGSIFAGIPAKKIKDIDQNLQKNEVERIAENYLLYASWYKK